VAIKSPINPQTIVKERPTSAPAAMNFISGGSPMGSSIVSSAANKIVGFQRGAAAVAPKAPDLGSIIKTLSTNILNNVESKVQSINQNVSNIVNQTLKTFSKDYQDRSKEVDTAKPSGILANFLKSYQQAMGFIQFLGNRKNIKTLGDNLQALQRVFSETFEIAKMIRKTIVKIVKQLSNLPTASSGAGGLNMDINVPGGMLRKTAPRGVMTALKLAGAGAAVAGGGMAVNAISSSFGGGEVQAAQSSGSEGLSGPMLDRFSAILDRFSEAIDSLSQKKSAPAAAPPPSGGGGDTQEKKDPSGKTASGVTTGTGSSSAGENIAAFTATLEATGDQDQADVMQVMINRAKGDPSKLAHEVTGKAQFTPMSSAIYGVTGHDKAADAKYGHIAPLLGKTPEERKSNLYKLAEGPEGLNNLDKLFKTKNAAQASKVLNDFKTGGTLSAKSQADVAGGRYFKGMSSNPGEVYLQRGPRSNKFHTLNGQGGRGDTTYRLPVDDSIAKGVAKPGVTAASTPAATTQQIAQTVAQPAQQQPQVTVLPMAMNAGSAPPQAPASSGGGQPAQMSSGRQAPSMNASNDDNFLTLYSKMVYNIVDG
jgi:hypothetical protein